METRLTVESLAEKIAKENDAFNKLSKAEKRVKVAQDCIDRIALNQIDVSKGSFCDFRPSITGSIKTVLDVRDKPICRVCAKGGLFMSYVGRVNKLSRHQVSGGNHARNKEHKKLLEIFTLKQLDLIEIAFEGQSYLHTGIPYSKIRRCEKFYDENYYNTSRRLIKICENIIENKGTFKL